MDVTRDKHFVVKYDHERNRQCHSVEGAAEVLRALFAGDFPRTVLDVGCGTGRDARTSMKVERLITRPFRSPTLA